MGLAERIAAISQTGAPPTPPEQMPYFKLLQEFCIEARKLRAKHVELALSYDPFTYKYLVWVWPKNRPNHKSLLFAVDLDRKGKVAVHIRLFANSKAFEDWLFLYYQSPEFKRELNEHAAKAREDVEGYLILPAPAGGTRGFFQVIMENQDFHGLTSTSVGTAVATCRVRVAPYQYNGTILPPLLEEVIPSARFDAHEIIDVMVCPSPDKDWSWVISGIKAQMPRSPKDISLEPQTSQPQSQPTQPQTSQEEK